MTRSRTSQKSARFTESMLRWVWSEAGGKLRVCKRCGNEFPQQAM